jgi:hypothetical protein
MALRIASRFADRALGDFADHEKFEFKLLQIAHFGGRAR